MSKSKAAASFRLIDNTDLAAPGGDMMSLGGFSRVSNKIDPAKFNGGTGRRVEMRAPLARQCSLKNSIGCSGVGLHSGVKVNMMLRPADPGTGILFRRTDVASDVADIQADIRHVVDATMGTTVGNKSGTTVATVEHMMAALHGCGIDNLIVELDGPEVPIMDGSSAPFVFLVECAGKAFQDAARRAIEILRPIAVVDGDKRAALMPGAGFTLAFEIDFESGIIGHQDLEFRMVNGNFKEQLGRARTFGFTHEIEKLRAMGLARGGSLENAIVVSGDTILNEDGLRFDDEFVRHKILDCVGDLYLAGSPIIGHFHGRRSGHALNHNLLRTLLADPSAWRYTTSSSDHDRDDRDLADDVQDFEEASVATA